MDGEPSGLSGSSCSTPIDEADDLPNFNPISLMLAEVAQRTLSLSSSARPAVNDGAADESALPPAAEPRPEPKTEEQSEEPPNDEARARDEAPGSQEPEEAEQAPPTGKQVYVLSSAGKPVFCRYGDESREAAQFGVMQALISIVRDTGGGDSLRYIRTGTHLICFLMRDPLYYIAVTPAGPEAATRAPREPEGAVRRQLGALHAQIASILTSKAFGLMERTPGYDLRNLLGGCGRQLRSLLSAMEGPPGAGFMLGAVRSVRLPPSTRAEAQRVLAGALRGGNLLFGALVAGWRLVALARPRRLPLHPLDLQLFLNLMACTGAFRRSENFTPVCLPHFNDRGFVHAYVQYVASEVALVLVTPDAGTFFELQAAKDALQRQLSESGSLYAINEAAKADDLSAREAQVPELRHFLYRVSPPAGSGGPPQYIAPAYEAPYAPATGSAARLARLYEVAHARIHDAEGSAAAAPVPAAGSFGPPAAAGPGAGASRRKLVYLGGALESVLAWRHSEFELYGAVEPGVSKPGAVAACNRLLRWLKREEPSMLLPFG